MKFGKILEENKSPDQVGHSIPSTVNLALDRKQLEKLEDRSNLIVDGFGNAGNFDTGSVRFELFDDRKKGGIYLAIEVINLDAHLGNASGYQVEIKGNREGSYGIESEAVSVRDITQVKKVLRAI